MYTLTATSMIVRDSDQALIPADILNQDYLTYLNWVNSGNKPTPYTAPVKQVPQVVNPRQIRMALTQLNLRGAVESTISSGSLDLQDWYNHSPIFERGHPIVLQVATALHVTSDQLDALWNLAAAL